MSSATLTPPAAAAPAVNPLLTAPLLPTLLRFALPNMVAMLAGAMAAIAETSYVGSFGVASLAGMALVFPMVMLNMMLSGGAMGGGVSSAASVATVWLWMKGLAQVPAPQAGVFTVMLPITAAAVGVLFLGEPFGSGHLAALALALLGLLLATWPAR